MNDNDFEELISLYDDSSKSVVQKTKNKLFESAKHFFINGKYTSARHDITKFLKKNPENIDARLLLARIHHRLDESEKATQEYIKVFKNFSIDLCLENDDVRYFIEFCESQIGKDNSNKKELIQHIENMLHVLQKAKTIEHFYIIKLHFIKATTCFEINNIDEAIKELDLVLARISPKHARGVLYFRGVCYAAKSNNSLAKEDLKKIIDNKSSINDHITLNAYILMIKILTEENLETFKMEKRELVQNYILQLKKLINKNSEYIKIYNTIEKWWGELEDKRIKHNQEQRPQFIEKPVGTNKKAPLVFQESCKHDIDINNCPICASWAPTTYSVRWDD